MISHKWLFIIKQNNDINILYKMIVKEDIDLTDFKFWSGAADFAEQLTPDELDTIQSMLEDAYPDGIDKTELNDFFWFDQDTICEWIGRNPYDDEDENEEEDENDDNVEESYRRHGRRKSNLHEIINSAIRNVIYENRR
jgi:hypothetical protein